MIVFLRVQMNYENSSMEEVCGVNLYGEYVKTKKLMEQYLINDPIVTRLWILILFLCSPLDLNVNSEFCDVKKTRKFAVWKVQENYVGLLWKYLCHRHTNCGAFRILSELSRVYLNVQRLTEKINEEIRTRPDLRPLEESLNRTVKIEIDEN